MTEKISTAPKNENNTVPESGNNNTNNPNSITKLFWKDNPLMQLIEKVPFFAPLKDALDGLKKFFEKIGINLSDLKAEVEENASHISDIASAYSLSPEDIKNLALTPNGEALWKSEAFQKAIQKVCNNLGINPDHLKLVMHKESKLDPKAQNKDTQATGLIQFMPKTAKGLGTSVEALKNMSAIEQLIYVEKYYKQFPKWSLDSPGKLYLATFYPAAIGKDPNFVIGSEVSSKRAELIASQNPAIAKHADGDVITVADFDKYVAAKA